MNSIRRERRHAQRIPKVFLCWFDGGHRDVEACVENVSSDGSGLFVRTPEQPEDEKVVLLIQSARRQTISVRGLVRWSSEQLDHEGFALHVENADELRAFLQRCLVAPGD